MSTRGLVGCRQGGQLHACYNHMDSYPSYLGKRVVDFCRMINADRDMYAKFFMNWAAVEWIKDGSDIPTVGQERKIMEAGFLLESRYLDELQEQGVNQGQAKDWYWLTRDFQGAETFSKVLQGWPYLVESSKFLEDSMFCEFAYIINLDSGFLEFYKGFQKVYIGEPGYDAIKEDPHDEEWVSDGFGGHHAVKGRPYKYGPSKKVGELPIDQLTKDNWKKFYPEEEWAEATTK